MTPEQETRLKGQLVLIDALLALPGVSKHETRFAHEVALVAEAAAAPAVTALVESRLGAPRKAAGAPTPADLETSAVVAAMGGLRAAQTLYLASLGDELWLYVAFWPWGGGQRFTIKIGVHEGAV